MLLEEVSHGVGVDFVKPRVSSSLTTDQDIASATEST